MTIIILVVVVGGFIYLSKSIKTYDTDTSVVNKEINMAKILDLQSSAFTDNEMIPSKYTCEGKNVVPPLQISNTPAGTKSLALILDDTDVPSAPGGIFTHWVVWNMPPNTKGIIEGQEPDGILGKGTSGKEGYIGPCPPTGTHHYHFKLFALDTVLTLEKGSDKQSLENAMISHILDETELIGLYKKSK